MTNTNIKNVASSPLSFLTSQLPINKPAIEPQAKPPTTLEALPKPVYDSLAPLNIPSKPIVYVEEKTSDKNSSAPKTSSDADPAGDDSRLDEKAKLESILLNSMSQTSATYKQNETNKSLNRFGLSAPANAASSANSWPRMPNGMMQPARLPPNYVCTICKKPGHHKSLCPEAGTIQKSEETVKLAKGIPRSFQIPAEKGHKFAMLTADGSYVVSVIDHKAAQVVKKDKQIFLDEDEDESSKDKQKGDDSTASSAASMKIPPELKCPYGDHIMKDAVLVPCCGHFVCCDSCIREKISNDGIEEIECPYEGCEIGSLGSITPFHEIRKKVSDFLNTQRQSTAAAYSSDPFLDSLLNDVDEKSTLNPAKLSPPHPIELKSELDDNKLKSLDKETRADSPLQDSKISSSEAQSARPFNPAINLAVLATDLAKPKPSEGMMPTAVVPPQMQQPALLPTPSIPTASIPPNTQPFMPSTRPPMYLSDQSNMSHMNNAGFIRNPMPPSSNAYIQQANPSFPNQPIRPFQNKITRPNMMPNANPPFMPQQARPNMPMPVQQQQQQQQQQFNPNLAFQNQNRPPFNQPFNQPRMNFEQPMYPNPVMYNPNVRPAMSANQFNMNNMPLNVQAPMMNPMMAQMSHQMPLNAMPIQQGPMFQAAPMNQMGPNGGMLSQASFPSQEMTVNQMSMNPLGSSGIMSKDEFYQYQERLRKEREAVSGARKYDSAKSRRSYSRSYSRSRSRSRKRRSGSRSSSRSSYSSRSSNERRRNRNYRSKSRSKSRTRKYASGYYNKNEYNDNRYRYNNKSSYYQRRSRSRSAEKVGGGGYKSSIDSAGRARNKSYSRSPNRQNYNYNRQRARSPSAPYEPNQKYDESYKPKIIESSIVKEGSREKEKKSHKDKEKKSSRESKDRDYPKEHKKDKLKSSSSSSKLAEKRPSSNLMPTIDESIVVSVDDLNGRHVSSGDVEVAKKKKKSSNESTSAASTPSGSSVVVEQLTLFPDTKEGSFSGASDKEEKEKKSSKHKSKKKHKHKHKRRSSSKN